MQCLQSDIIGIEEQEANCCPKCSECYSKCPECLSEPHSVQRIALSLSPSTASHISLCCFFLSCGLYSRHCYCVGLIAVSMLLKQRAKPWHKRPISVFSVNWSFVIEDHYRDTSKVMQRSTASSKAGDVTFSVQSHALLSLHIVTLYII